ncbi:MAG: hypothetical protein OXE92_02505 [Bacteroidetes bacterium]|nr:hypothetical protein [Bacteroidota bacterium]
MRRQIEFEYKYGDRNGQWVRWSKMLAYFLDALEEKGCFHTSAIQCILRNMLTSYNRIQATNWEYTSGKQLAQLLTK